MNDYNLPTCSWRFYRNIFRWHWYIKIGQLYPSSEFYYTIQREDLVQTIINGIFNINFPIFIIRIYFKCTVRSTDRNLNGIGINPESIGIDIILPKGIMVCVSFPTGNCGALSCQFSCSNDFLLQKLENAFIDFLMAGTKFTTS